MKKIATLILSISIGAVLSLNGVYSGVRTASIVSKSKPQTKIIKKQVNTPIIDFRVVTKADTSAEFKWTQPRTLATIQIKQSVDNGKTWRNAEIDILNPNSAKITSLKPNTVYKFKLTISIGKNISDSNVVVFRTDKANSTDNSNSTTAITGNSNANIINGGYVAQEGEWIYFNDTYKNKIYKVKIDGTKKTKLSDDDGNYINVLKGWVYYINYSNGNKVCKMRINGTQKKILANDSSSQIHVIGDWIYYTNNKGIAKMKIDGSYKTQLNNDSALYINIDGNWIYYYNDSEDISERGIYKIKIDGSNRTKINEDGSIINIAGNWIYYINNDDDQKLYKMRIDGAEKTKLTDYGVDAINVVGSWIYYNLSENDKGHFGKMKIDGTDDTKLFDDSGYGVNILSNWCYYLKKTGSKFRVYRIKADGTGWAGI